MQSYGEVSYIQGQSNESWFPPLIIICLFIKKFWIQARSTSSKIVFCSRVSCSCPSEGRKESYHKDDVIRQNTLTEHRCMERHWTFETHVKQYQKCSTFFWHAKICLGKMNNTQLPNFFSLLLSFFDFFFSFFCVHASLGYHHAI